MKKLVVIGIGGIGSNLLQPLCRFLAYEGGEWLLTLVDGDSFEHENANRQVMFGDGNKAEAAAAAINLQFPQLVVLAKPWYIDSEKALLVIEEGSTVILCVDNHHARKLVSDFCQGLRAVTLISGGNAFLDGNVQVYIRKNGKDVTASLTQYHPEIRNPKGKDPTQAGCGERVESAPQLLVTNFMAAAHIFAAFYRNIAEDGEMPAVPPGEIYFSIVNGAAIPQERSPEET